MDFDQFSVMIDIFLLSPFMSALQNAAQIYESDSAVRNLVFAVYRMKIGGIVSGPYILFHIFFKPSYYAFTFCLDLIPLRIPRSYYGPTLKAFTSLVSKLFHRCEFVRSHFVLPLLDLAFLSIETSVLQSDQNSALNH